MTDNLWTTITDNLWTCTRCGQTQPGDPLVFWVNDQRTAGYYFHEHCLPANRTEALHLAAEFNRANPVPGEE
jgi:hypothetical protein